MTDENSCFVFGLQLDGKGRASDIDGSTSAPNQWLHIDYSSASAEPWLQARQLDPHIVQALVRSDTRPRTFAFGKGVLVVLRAVNSNPGSEPEDMVSLRMWIEAERLITVRQRRLTSVQDVQQQFQAGIGPESIPDLVASIIESIADRISNFVDDIEELSLGYEASVTTSHPNTMRREVSTLRRQVAVVRRFLAPQRDALDALFRSSKGILNDEHSYIVREQCDRITRYVEDLDLVRERALVIQEELMNRVAQQQNARMYVLSIVAAIFLPITFITGLFGMNVGGVPGVEVSSAFWQVCAVMAVISLGVVVLFRLKRWL